MSNVLAIAAVTQLLKDLLNDALINGNASQVLQQDFSVTSLPPDRIIEENAETQPARLNVFLHRITPNEALRNADLPARDGSGRLVRAPRLALDLHYMLTAVAAQELHPEILLGYAMELFHEHAILPREIIRSAVGGSVSGDILPDAFRDDELGPIRASQLADQIEHIKITPSSISLDDMSKMWTALQTSYRTTVAYDVSVVLIERDRPVRPTVPVLSRGGPIDPKTGRDPGVLVRPSLAATAPTLLSLEPLDGQPVMRLGVDVALLGHALEAPDIRVRFAPRGGGSVLGLAPLEPATATRLVVRLPSGAPLSSGDPLSGTSADPTAWRIGIYSVSVRLTDSAGREVTTGALPVALAPNSTATVQNVSGKTRITLTSRPPIAEGQTVAVLVGRQMEILQPPTSATDEVEADFDGLPSGAELPVRLRVDGIDSPVIDRSIDPPKLVTVTIP